MFIAWRKIVHGFEGYQYPPPLNDVAKSILLKEDGEEQFKKYYGDYYIKGCVNGASMKLVVRTEYSGSSNTDSLDISMRASWNGGLFSASGGFKFS